MSAKGKVIQVPGAFETVAPAGSLFALTGTYLDAQRKLAEIDLDPQTVADTLESLEGDIAVKSVRVIAIAQQYEAFADGCAMAANRMQQRASANIKRANLLRDYVLASLQAAGFEAGDKIESPEISLRLQRNPPSVEITDASLIPGFYWRTPDTPADVIDKKAILEDLKAEPKEGEPPAHIPGARLVSVIRLVEK